MSAPRRPWLPAALALAALLTALPAAALVPGSWRPVGGSAADAFSLQVEAAEPSMLHALRDGALWRLVGDDGSWQPVAVPEPQDLTFPDGERLVVTEARITGFWQAPRRPPVLYAAWLYDADIVAPNGTPITNNTASHLLRSVDGGATWEQLPKGHAQTAAVAPSAPLTLYVTFVDPSRRPTFGAISERLTASGSTVMAPVDEASGNRFLAAIAVDAARPDHLYAIGAEQRLFSSADGGASWQESGLTPGVTAVAAHPTLPGIALAGAPDGRVWRTADGGASWEALAPLPAAETLFGLAHDPVDAGRYYALPGGVPHASDDAGASWQAIAAGLPAGAVVRQLVVDPADPSRLFASVVGAGVWLHDRTFPPAPCVADAATLCLGVDGRFEVRAAWRDFAARAGLARALPLAADDSGAFWFFDAENYELVVKVLDGRAINERFWVFYGALSNVDYTLVVTDTTSGETVGYHNPLHRFASRGDTTALPEDLSNRPPPPGEATAPVETLVAPEACVPGATVHCLAGGRFRVEVEWSDFSGGSGVGAAVAASDDTGLFWFFRAGNLELAVKVLDGRAVNGHWWLFYGALTNVAFNLRVTDTVSGEVRTYVNPRGNFASRGDTTAFAGS